MAPTNHAEVMPSRPRAVTPTQPRPDPARPFLHSIAHAAGISDDELAGPAYRQLFWGVHIGSFVPITRRVRAAAALLIAPSDAAISHMTAARLLGAVVPDDPTIHVTMPRGSRFNRTGIRTHRSDCAHKIITHRGLRMTSPERTFVDCARLLDLVDLVVMGDALVKAGRTTPQRLLDYCADHTGGRSLARRAARLVRDRVDSPMETRLRLLIVLAGLPEPLIDVQLNRPDGTLYRRIDLAYPAARLAIEYDGVHHEERGQRAQDLERREELESQGWTFVVVVSSQLNGDPARVLERIVQGMRRCGIETTGLKDGWRRHLHVRVA